jgi:hypothetical protein
MSDDKKPVEKPAEEKPKAAAKAPLGVAAESGDPAVQDLLAQRAGAESNGDEKAVAAVDKALAELGVTV